MRRLDGKDVAIIVGVAVVGFPAIVWFLLQAVYIVTGRQPSLGILGL